MNGLGNNIRIILCTMNNMVRQSVTDFLISNGFSIDYSKELDAIKQRIYNIIIIDMDDYDIEEVLYIKRLVPSYTNFIIMKSDFDTVLVDKLKSNDLTNVVKKPYNLNILKSKIIKVIG